MHGYFHVLREGFLESVTEAGLLEIKKAGLTGDIYITESFDNEAACDEGKIERMKSAVTRGAAVRVFKNNRMGFSYTTAVSEEGIKEAVKSASFSAYMEGFEGYVLPGPAETPRINLSDAAYGSMTPDKRKQTVLEFESAVKKSDSRIVHVRDTVFKDLLVRTHFANTSGSRCSLEKTLYLIMTSAVASDGKSTEVSDAYSQSCVFSGIDVKKTAAEAADRAVGILGGEPLATGSYALIFPEHTAAELVYLLSKIFHAGSIAKGKSILSEIKKGAVIASKHITLRDDALLDMKPGSFALDAEGYAAKNKVLIENGIYQGFYSDSFYAAALNESTSGNCVRQDFRALPEPGTSNIYIQGNSADSGEFLKTASGIYINSLMGLHTADPVSGNFSLGINGWVLEKGTRIKAVKECLITGNIKDILERTVTAAGTPVFYGNCGAPVLYVEGMTAAGR